MKKLDAPSIPRTFELRAARYGARAFVTERRGGHWRGHSWEEIADAVSRLRAGLAGHGIAHGDRVAILAENCPQWVIADLAILGLGGVVVPLYPTSSSEEIRHILDDSGARMVAVLGQEHLRRVLAICEHLPEVQAVIAMEPGAAVDRGRLPVLSLESLSAGGAGPTASPGRDDLATIIYTSGTTGTSKGVLLTHGNILSNCESSLNALDLGEHDVTLSFLPIAHSFERTAGYYTVMAAGGAITYAEGLGQIAQNLLQVNPTVVLTVPRLLEVVHDRVMRTVEKGAAARKRLFELAFAIGRRAAAYRYEGHVPPPHLSIATAAARRLVLHRIHALFGNRLRYLISGGAPLPREIFEFFSAAEVPLVEGYGLTEASPVVSVNLLGRTRPGTVGRALDGIEVRLAPDGELLVRGANVMRGYYRRPKDTREAIDEQGFLHTGDIAVIDDDGFIAIRDRKKEIIVLSGGKNVSPAGLEAKLGQDPMIAQVCVVGDRRKHPAALLVPNFEAIDAFIAEQGLAGHPPEELVKERAVRDLFHRRLREINRELADYEAIGAFVLIPSAFSQERSELTPTLKLRRKIIAQHYQREIDALYEA